MLIGPTSKLVKLVLLLLSWAAKARGVRPCRTVDSPLIEIRIYLTPVSMQACRPILLAMRYEANYPTSLLRLRIPFRIYFRI